jgi:hypothetical protein
LGQKKFLGSKKFLGQKKFFRKNFKNFIRVKKKCPRRFFAFFHFSHFTQKVGFARSISQRRKRVLAQFFFSWKAPGEGS